MEINHKVDFLPEVVLAIQTIEKSMIRRVRISQHADGRTRAMAALGELIGQFQLWVESTVGVGEWKVCGYTYFDEYIIIRTVGSMEEQELINAWDSFLDILPEIEKIYEEDIS